MSACVLRSAIEQPSTHELRVTAVGYTDDKELTAAHGRFLRKLRRAECEYLAVNEWGISKQRHLHVIARADSAITAQQVWQWWAACLPKGTKGSSHCAPIRCVDAFVRYAFKHNTKRTCALVPSNFKGKVFTTSRAFFIRKLDMLWQEVRDQWYGKKHDEVKQTHGLLSQGIRASRRRWNTAARTAGANQTPPIQLPRRAS
jgi:hypothetical protein